MHFHKDYPPFSNADYAAISDDGILAGYVISVPEGYRSGVSGSSFGGWTFQNHTSFAEAQSKVDAFVAHVGVPL